MSWLDGLRHRLRAVLNPSDYERELREEHEFHQELDARQLRDADAARRRFGNRTHYQEETRDMTWIARFDGLRQDLGYAWRSVRRSPSFTILVVVTLALGVGVNAAVFSVIDQLYLRPPAGVQAPEEIRRVWIESFRVAGRASSTRQPVNYPMFQAYAAAYGDTTRFAAVTGNTDLRLGGTRQGPLVDQDFVSHNFFALLGVRPALGRFFTPDEDRVGGEKVVVLGWDVWQNHLGGDTAIVGRHVKLDTTRYLVVGVAPRGFTGIDVRPAHLWSPLRTIPQADWLKGGLFESHRMYQFRGFYRQSPGRPDAAFEQAASARLRALSREQWKTNPDTLLNVRTGPILEARGPGDRDARHAITTRLAGVAAIILLIAVANVVNLLLARATSRRREIAVRLALGISRARLVRLLSVETLLLAVIAAIAATLVSGWSATALRSFLLPDVEWASSALHWRVVAFTFAIACAAGLAAGIIPALQFSRPRLTRSLKDGSEGAGTRQRLRSGLLVAQAALSLVLLVGAGLFVRSLRNVQEIDIGYDAAQLLFARVAFEPGQAPPLAERAARVSAVQARLAGRPGIEATARTSMEPMRGLNFWTFYWGNDSSASITRNYPTVQFVTADYFAATGTRLLRGRVFGRGAEASQEVVVNEAMARMLWPGQDALGQCLRFRKDGPCHVVTGIVETVAQDKVIEEPQPQFYLALDTPATASAGGTALIVRVRESDDATARREIERMLQAEFPSGYPSITPMREYLEPEYRPWKLGAALFTGAGILALLVSLVGIYSSVAYAVSQRTREFGVRMALGARVADILRLVVEEGLRVVLLGIALGVGLALVASRLIATMLFGVESTDLSVLLFVSCTMIVVAGLAALAPAWKAARVDPVGALKSE